MLQTRTNIGERDRWITFQERVVIDNVYNEDQLTGWRNVDVDPEVKTRVRELSRTGSTEIYEADKLTAISLLEFNVRYRSDINTMNRIIYNSVIYDIVSITEGARVRELIINAESSGINVVSELSGGFTVGFNIGFK